MNFLIHNHGNVTPHWGEFRHFLVMRQCASQQRLNIELEQHSSARQLVMLLPLRVQLTDPTYGFTSERYLRRLPRMQSLMFGGPEFGIIAGKQFDHSLDVVKIY